MRVIWVGSQRGGTVTSPTSPPFLPPPAPPPKEQRVRKSRRRGALGEQKQPKLADWLIRLEKPTNNVERMAAGKPDHTEEQMDRHKEISTYEDKPNQNEPDTNQIEIGQPDTKFEDSQPTPSSRSEMKMRKPIVLYPRKGFVRHILV